MRSAALVVLALLLAAPALAGPAAVPARTMADALAEALGDAGVALPDVLATPDGSLTIASRDLVADLARVPLGDAAGGTVVGYAARPHTSGPGCAGVMGTVLKLHGRDEDMRFRLGPATGATMCGRYPEHAAVVAEFTGDTPWALGALTADAAPGAAGPVTAYGFGGAKLAGARGFAAHFYVTFQWDLFVFLADDGAAVVTDAGQPQALCAVEEPLAPWWCVIPYVGPA